MVKKTESKSPQEILEQGNVYFLYRPKVRGVDEAEGDEEVAAEDIDDVQNFYIVLKPQGGRFRLINIGRKRLPDIEGHERNWGFVELVADSGKEIEESEGSADIFKQLRFARSRHPAEPLLRGEWR